MELHSLENKGAAAPKLLLFELLTQEREWEIEEERKGSGGREDGSGQWCCQATAATLQLSALTGQGLGQLALGMFVSSGQIPGNCRTPGHFPLLPLCPPTGIIAFPSTPSREGKEGSVRPGSPPLGCRRAHSPHPSKTTEPKGADLVPVLNNGWQEQL